jgi:hypothetical protein
VENFGLDGSGAHCGKTEIQERDLVSMYTPLAAIEVKNSNKAKKIFADYFNSIFKKNGMLRMFKSFRSKILNIFKTTNKKLCIWGSFTIYVEI